MPERLTRVSVAVDDKTRAIIEELAKKENETISDIIRKAIKIYYKLKDRNISARELEKYADIIPFGDNVIIDLDLWLAILDKIDKEFEDKEFWNLIERIGYEHGVEYISRGMSLRDVLKLLEFKRLLELKESNGSYTLILTTRNESKILKHYLTGILKAFNINAEFIVGLRKIVIIPKMSP